MVTYMDKKLASVSLYILLLALTIAVGTQMAQADSNGDITYSSGIHLISPVNTTYTTNMLTLNLTFNQGMQCQLNYSIDGQYCGDIPLTNATEYHILMTEMVGKAKLPPLSDGTHYLTINVQANLNDYHGANPPGAPFKATNPEGTNFSAVWEHTVYFTVDTGNTTPTATPITVTAPTPSPTPTHQSTAANPTQTVQPPVSEPQSQATLLGAILIVGACAAYVAVIAVLVFKKR